MVAQLLSNCNGQFLSKTQVLGQVFSAAQAAKGGFGWQPQQVSDRGTNERKAKFGTLVDTCSP
jgi:hypothetical protein